MLGPEERQQFKRKMLGLKIFWGFSLIALVLYVYTAHQIGDEMADTSYSDTTLLIMKITLAILSVWGLVVAYLMRKFMLATSSKGPKSKFIKRIFSPKARLFTSGSQAAAKYSAVVILSSIALAESVGIYGLVLFIKSGEFVTLYAFIGVSALGLLYFRPKFEELEQFVINMKLLEKSM